jgi:hypothetical protein
MSFAPLATLAPALILYGIDLPAAVNRARNDDLAWAQLALEEYQANGFPDEV